MDVDDEKYAADTTGAAEDLEGLLGAAAATAVKP